MADTVMSAGLVIAPQTTPPDTLSLTLSSTNANGIGAEFVVFVNGVPLGAPQAVSGQGVNQTFTFTGKIPAGAQIAVGFLNEATGRAMTLHSVTLDGKTYSTPVTFYHNGEHVVAISNGVATIDAPGSIHPALPSYTPPASTTPPSTPPTSPPVSPPVSPPSTPLVASPSPPAIPAGSLTSVTLQNTGSTALAARLITFSQGFADGQLAAGKQLVATGGSGAPIAVQVDATSSYADGSVRTADLTLLQPALAAGATAPLSLAVAPAAAAPPVNIAALLTDGYALTVDLAVHNAGGADTAYHVDVASLLKAALASGTASYWMQGPQATEVRLDTPITGSLHLTFDVRLYADGTTSTDVQFNNDKALTAQGGEVSYDATIKQGGSVAFQQANINQYQYQTWHQEVSSNGAPTVNVQQNIAALETAGFIQNYDLTTGVSTALLQNEASHYGGPTYGVLGPASITQYMPQTGGRADIGPQPAWNTLWLLTQSAQSEQFALAQADAGGSIPWHLATGAADGYVTSTSDPTLWSDTRGLLGDGATGLTQQIPTTAQTGWTLNSAHEPDTSYVAYLMTGDRYYLDQLNAEASYDVISHNPGYRDLAQGIFANGHSEVRDQAWSLREVVEAAAVNPAGSAMGIYFNQIAVNNIQALTQQIETEDKGQLSGYVDGSYGDSGAMAPWEQDFLATTVAQAAELGIPGAKQLLTLETNFLAGRFLNGANGFSPYDGSAYNLIVSNGSQVFTTWAQVGAATTAAGLSNGGVWAANEQYTHGAEAALADSFTVTGSTQALQAYGWVLGHSGVAGGLSTNQADPTFDIVPRLPDGNLLTSDHVLVSNDTIAGTLTAPKPDFLIDETGAAAMTLKSGGGVGILFAGSGATSLVGSSGQDYLFGGAGATTFQGGAGVNFMQAGSGAALFMLSPGDAAQDTITAFKPGADHLQVAGAAPGSAALASLIGGATMDASGNAVLHLGASHTVTLQAIGVAQLSSKLFA